MHEYLDFIRVGAGSSSSFVIPNDVHVLFTCAAVRNPYDVHGSDFSKLVGFPRPKAGLEITKVELEQFISQIDQTGCRRSAGSRTEPEILPTRIDGAHDAAVVRDEQNEDKRRN